MKQQASAPRILLLDIETFPVIGYVWSLWDTNVIKVIQNKCIATIAWKWLDEKQVHAAALNEFKGYKAKSYDDAEITKVLWTLLDEADVIVAHNGRSFDVKEVQARFIVHKLPPTSPFKVVDTKVEVKKAARFSSNKLDDLGEQLGEGRKIKTDFSLWEGCILGDPAAWAKMVKYNKQDVLLLERVYIRLLPWINSHPNYGTYRNDSCCPKCGSKDKERRGFSITSTRRYQRYQCKGCGGWYRSVASEKTEKGKRPHVHAI